MGDEKTSSIPDVSEQEERFLNRLSRKYEKSETAGRIRSYLIATVVIMVLFAISRWIPWWGIALLLVEAVGLTLFHQYKRFANFKTRLLRKLWWHLGQNKGVARTKGSGRMALPEGVSLSGKPPPGDVAGDGEQGV